MTAKFSLQEIVFVLVTTSVSIDSLERFAPISLGYLSYLPILICRLWTYLPSSELHIDLNHCFRNRF